MVYCARVDLSICFVCGQPNAFTLRFPIAPIMEKDAPVELSVMSELFVHMYHIVPRYGEGMCNHDNEMWDI